LAQEADDDKQFEPTERKLSRAREQGDIVRSEDLQTAAVFGGFVLGLLIAGGWAILASADAGMSFLAQADRMSELPEDAILAQVAGLAIAMAGPALVLVCGPLTAVMIYLLASGSLNFATSKLEFKLSRISILANAKEKFGLTGLAEFAKRSTKLLAISTLLAIFLTSRMDQVLMSSRLEVRSVSLLMSDLLISFLQLFLIIALVFGAIDYLWQRSQFLRRNRMSRQEMVDEHKENEGDPQLKADRRQRGQEIAMNRMLSDVPKSDVIIVNPTHYAVALKWSRGKGSAPRCVAKGTDEIAARIREHAQAAGVPIRQDPPTARAIFATVEIGKEIRVEHFAAVAAAIRFADAMRLKARRR
jgi:flagellar biosynthetic protein FlhB